MDRHTKPFDKDTQEAHVEIEKKDTNQFWLDLMFFFKCVVTCETSTDTERCAVNK